MALQPVVVSGSVVTDDEDVLQREVVEWYAEKRGDGGDRSLIEDAEELGARCLVGEQ